MGVKSRRFLAGIAALPLLGGGLLVGTGPAVAAGCPVTKIFEVGGAGDGAGRAYDAFNRTVPPGVHTEQVVYSGSLAPIVGDKLLDDSVAEGIDNLNRTVRGFHTQCPGSHITITGYSEGAIVAGNQLERLSRVADIPHRQINGVLYGDPRRAGVPGAGLNGGAGGVMTNIPTFFPRTTMQGARPGFGAIPVRQLCNQNDAICNSENPINNLLAFINGWVGYAQGDHGYLLNPIADAGNGDRFVRQPPRVQYGPPLPIPSPTPWQLFNGNFQLSQDFVRGLRDTVRRVAPPDVWRQLVAAMPWIERL